MASGSIDSTGSASSDCAQTIRLDGAMDRVLGERMVADTVVSALTPLILTVVFSPSKNLPVWR